MSRGTSAEPSEGAVLKRNLALFALLLATVTTRFVLREIATGKAEMAAADDASTRAAWAEAIGHARAAAEAFVPGSPWPERGLARLDSIGHDATIRGDRRTALLAYGAVRSATLATRSPGSSNSHWRSLADDALIRLAASDPNSARSHAQSYDWTSAMRADLSEPSRPAPWALAALSASVFGILVAIACLREAAWLGPRALVAKLVIVAGFAMYAVLTLLS
jgi:hypothetical protein